MKRALAERAKQSGLPNGVAVASPGPGAPLSGGEGLAPSESLSSPSQKPLKVPRIEPPRVQAPPPIPAVSTSTGTPAASPRTKGNKRQRQQELNNSEDEDDDANASSFYLRHQNRALASELSQGKYQLKNLERERDYRRMQCSKACQLLNSLQATWTQMEAALQLGQPPSASTMGGPSDSNSAPPPSTGSRKSVELIGALLDSLAALGNNGSTSTRRRIDDQDEDDDSTTSSNSDNHGVTMEGAEQQQLDDLLRITDNIAQRAATLQDWIWSLLPKVEGAPAAVSDAVQLSQQLARQKAKVKILKQELKELARTRDEMQQSEKRVRRGLYRLAAGRVNLKEVLEAIETADEDKEAAVAWMEVAPAQPVALVPSSVAPTSAKPDENGETAPPVNSAQLAQLHQQLKNLEEVASARDEQIQTLLAEREEQVKRINRLVLEKDTNNTDVPSDEQAKRSDLYAQLTSKLATNDRKILEFEEGLGKIREECSQALGNAELARTALEDLQSKHSKKWAELSQEAEEDELAVTSTKNQGEQIVTLQHKLTQALENVRQAETTRRTLTEAVTMNESLQAKLDEVKTKYGALQAGRSSSNSNNNSGSSTNHVSTSSSSGGLSTPKPKSSSSSTPAQSAEKAAEKGEKMERLHREYRKVRKELAAVTASKEAAKSKLERIEKERDALVQTNARLLKQSAEKDDMNAKSLSTILHLKQVTDQITKERKSLEQQAKSANQLALAARLAANARERVSEEFMKEKKTLEQQVEDCEQKRTGLLIEKETMDGKNSQHKAKMEALLKDVDKAKSRCEELATESTRLHEEKQKMMELLAIAQREANDAVKASQGLTGSSGGGGGGGIGIPSEFTAEQLSTQVSVLKSRLVCPVCNCRDKKCILLRCRHMFCRACVDESIKNRSRKCPACGGRFDSKDVADVWL